MTVGNSRIVRSKDSDKYYLLEEGPAVPLLRLVLIQVEPIPSTEVWVESDWRIKRDTIDGIATIRVARGYEPNGVLDPQAS